MNFDFLKWAAHNFWRRSGMYAWYATVSRHYYSSTLLIWKLVQTLPNNLINQFNINNASQCTFLSHRDVYQPLVPGSPFFRRRINSRATLWKIFKGPFSRKKLFFTVVFAPHLLFSGTPPFLTFDFPWFRKKCNISKDHLLLPRVFYYSIIRECINARYCCNSLVFYNSFLRNHL